jgi:hypothetical protein
LRAADVPNLPAKPVELIELIAASIKYISWRVWPSRRGIAHPRSLHGKKRAVTDDPHRWVHPTKPKRELKFGATFSLDLSAEHEASWDGAVIGSRAKQLSKSTIFTEQDHNTTLLRAADTPNLPAEPPESIEPITASIKYIL